MAEVSRYINDHEYVINDFHDVNSNFYTVTNIYPQVEIFLKGINVFRSENVCLFTVTSIHNIQKSTKNRNSKTR